jgi:hypothetical protein
LFNELGAASSIKMALLLLCLACSMFLCIVKISWVRLFEEKGISGFEEKKFIKKYGKSVVKFYVHVSLSEDSMSSIRGATQRKNLEPGFS